MKWIGALALAAGLALGTIAIHYYGKFNRLIDAKLGGVLPQATVYAKPTKIWAGQEWTVDRLTRILEEAGYLPGRQAQEKSYKVTDNIVSFSVPRGETSRNIQIHFAGSRISKIVENRRPVREAELPPDFLSSLYSSSRVKRKPITFSEMPRQLVHAVIAVEDQDFFDHPGISLVGLLRALYRNTVNWDRGEGGSTLTQQFIKNYFLSPEKDYKRKLEELYFALLLERRFSKEEILELYANEVYLGQMGSFAILGFGQAAEAYFGKNVQQLNLNECATLAAMIRAPNRLSPHGEPEAILNRRNMVLDLMEENGFLSTRENAVARREPLDVRPPASHDYSEAPYFVDYLAQLLRADYGVERVGRRDLIVQSTLDKSLQRIAVEALHQGLVRIDRLLANRQPPAQAQAALVALDPSTGEILALVGGRDYASAQYNRATSALRQPGSAFKPFVYAAALESEQGRSLTLSSHLIDEPHVFHFEGKEYSPGNYGDRYYGPVSLRQALALSLNVPTVKLAHMVGFDTIASHLRMLSFTTELRPYPSLALGSFEVTLLELVQAYQTLANQGNLVPLKAMRSVMVDGVEVPAGTQSGERQVFEAATAFLLTSALQSALDEGTARSARAGGFDLPAAGKTGSTADSWFVGYTPELLCGVWVGTDLPPNLELTGAQAALPIWTDFMLGAQKGGYLKGGDFSHPPEITSREIDPGSGLLTSPGCVSKRMEFYIAGTEPQETCRDHKPQKADTLVKPARKSRWNWLRRIFRR